MCWNFFFSTRFSFPRTISMAVHLFLLLLYILKTDVVMACCHFLLGSESGYSTKNLQAGALFFNVSTCFTGPPVPRISRLVEVVLLAAGAAIIGGFLWWCVNRSAAYWRCCRCQEKYSEYRYVFYFFIYLFI